MLSDICTVSLATFMIQSPPRPIQLQPAVLFSCWSRPRTPSGGLLPGSPYERHMTKSDDEKNKIMKIITFSGAWFVLVGAFWDLKASIAERTCIDEALLHGHGQHAKHSRRTQDMCISEYYVLVLSAERIATQWH